MLEIRAIGKTFRLLEVAPFCGIALLGGLTQVTAEASAFPWALVFAITGSFFLSAFAFAFNDLQDIENDRQSESKSSRPLVSGSVSIRAVQVVTTVVAAAGIGLLLAGTPPHALGVGLSAIPVGALYSYRRFPLKTVPVLSSLTHLVFGTQIFTLGAWSLGGPDWSSPAIGAYFGLVFAAGHLHHEVYDLEADRRSGAKTCAVRFGSRPVLLAGFTLWCLSAVYFTILARLHLVPAIWAWIQGVMFACYLAGFLLLTRGRPDARNLKRLQTVYRVAYLTGGLLMVALSVGSLSPVW